MCISGVGAGFAPSPFAGPAAVKAGTAANAAKGMDADGDQDGSRPGEVEAGKGARVDRYA